MHFVKESVVITRNNMQAITTDWHVIQLHLMQNNITFCSICQNSSFKKVEIILFGTCFFHVLH